MAITLQQFWRNCACCFWICAAVQVANGQSVVNKIENDRSRQNSHPVRLDEWGDPLPPQARFQLGTERFVPRRPVFDLALSPDGKTVLTRDSENIQSWDAEAGKIRWVADADTLWSASYGLRAFAFTRNSEFFYSQSEPESLLKWNVATGKSTAIPVKNPLPLLPENRPVNSFPGATLSIDVNQEGSRIAAAGGHGIVVYDPAGNSLLEIANKPHLAVAPEDWHQDQMLFGGHYSLAVFSPDGKTLAVVTSDSPTRLRLLDASTGEQRCVVELGSRLVRMAFAPDGRSIATTERSSAVSVFSTATGKLQWRSLFEPPAGVQGNAFAREAFASAVAYSPDGKLVAAAVPPSATDASSVGHKSPDGKLVAAAVPRLGREVICIFDATDGALRSQLKGHREKVWGLAFNADSTTLFSAGLDRIIRRWDVGKAIERPLEKGFHGSGIVATIPDGNYIAVGDSHGKIHLLETTKQVGLASKQEVRIIDTQSPELSALALSRDGRLVASGYPAEDGLRVTIWSTATSEVVHRWQWRERGDQPAKIAVGGPTPGYSIIEWRERGDQPAKIGTLEFSSDGTRLAAAAIGGGRAYLLDVKTGKEVAALEHDAICGLSFDRTGKQLVTAGANERLCFWDSVDGKLLSAKEMIGGDLQNVRCSPVDDLIVTAHFPNVLRMWNAKDMTLRKRAPLSGEANFEALAFSSDGNWLATGSSGIVNIMNPRTAERVWRAGSHSGRVSTLGFAEQNRVLVSGGDDGMVYCWELMPEEVDGPPDFDKLWLDLRDGGEAEVEKRQWELVQMGDPAVEEVERRLNSITQVINLRAITQGVDLGIAESRVRLALQLCDKNPAVEVDIRLKRAIDFLETLRSPKSIALLKQLASSHASKDVRKEAMFALEKIQ